MDHVRTDALDYRLPPDRIATRPAEPRDAARLMVVNRQAQDAVTLDHHQVRDLPDLGVLGPGDLMIVNESKVLPARFVGKRQSTGGRVEGLYLSESEPGMWQLMLESRGQLQPGESIALADHDRLVLRANLGQGKWQAQLQSPWSTLELLERIGHPPLPPYIQKARRQRREPTTQQEDSQRYQTVYSNEPGSTAAPTAGLHFTPHLLRRLSAMGIRRASVTLHVGPGTFAPVRSEILEDHPMHAEQVSVPSATIEAIRHARKQGGRILMVGTTSVRAVESLPQSSLEDSPGICATGPSDFRGPTSLFITPDRLARGQFSWRYTDMLLTNFHLPRSTLLAMVAALPDMDIGQLLYCYHQAIALGYRFYSYGDAMLIR